MSIILGKNKLGFNQKASLKSVVIDFKAKFIRIDAEVDCFDAEDEHIDLIPTTEIVLVASQSNYRDAQGKKITLEKDENGLSIIPENAISEFDYFLNINQLGTQIQEIIKQQILATNGTAGND
jgi:hypothetical protein